MVNYDSVLKTIETAVGGQLDGLDRDVSILIDHLIYYFFIYMTFCVFLLTSCSVKLSLQIVSSNCLIQLSLKLQALQDMCARCNSDPALMQALEEDPGLSKYSHAFGICNSFLSFPRFGSLV